MNGDEPAGVSYGGISEEVLDAIYAPELENLIKLKIAQGKAYSTLGKDQDGAQAFQSANAAFQNAADQVGSAMGVYGLSSMVVALLLSFYAARFRLNCRLVHFLSLTLGGIGFLSMFYISDPSQLKWSFALIGVAWASILSMPYALLSSSVDPKKMGVMMGLFNMFIVLPQIAAALGGVNAAYRLIGPETINAMTVAGLSLLIGGLLVYFVQDNAGDAPAVKSGGH